MIATVTLNPAVDKTVTLPNFLVNEVNRVQSIRLDPGGKGINVSKVVHALGEQTIVYGIVGGHAGSMIETALQAEGIPCMFSHSPDETRTNLKIVDPVCMTNTDINEPGATLTEEMLEDVWRKLSGSVHPGDMVVMAGKNPPGTNPDCLRLWTNQLHALGVSVAADTMGEPMKRLLGAPPDVIKPNLQELSDLVGNEVSTEKEIIHHLSEIVDRGVKLAVVSMGSDGAIFCDGDRMLRGKAPKVPVLSTVGAGDSMMAAMVCGFCKRMELEEIAAFALAVSGAKVSCPGSAPPTLAQAQSLMDQIVLSRL